MTEICITDTETTGFVPRDTCIIQIAVAKIKHNIDPLDIQLVSVREWKLQLPEGFTISPKVASINGYAAEVWRDQAEDRRLVILEYLKLLEWSSFGGQNPQFDYRHIDEELYRQGLSWPKMKHYTLFSVDMLARPLQIMGYVKDVKQETLSNFFGLGKQTHDALSDVRQCVELYRRLMWLACKGFSQEAVQDSVSEVQMLDWSRKEKENGI